MLITKIFTVRDELRFAVFLLLSNVIYTYTKNGVSAEKSFNFDLDPYETVDSTGRRIFDFRRNGIRVYAKAVPASTVSRKLVDDHFPDFPTGDIGRCLVSFSLDCARKRIGQFLESVRQLNEITLVGQDVKLVKTRVRVDRKINDTSDVNIQRSIDDFFDTFALRIMLPKWNGKPEKNQIDVMFDENAVVEGRRRGGGGGGGGGGGKGGGGKCRMMMMIGLVMVKMKLMGVMAMKSMMMAGMSLMLSTLMLMQRLMKSGAPWQGGRGPTKEIVFVSKAPGGGGDGCCSGGPGDSYGVPPSNAYGPPSGGGGYAGGGWGRSFGGRLITSYHDKMNYTKRPESANLSLAIGNSTPNTERNNHRNYVDRNFNENFTLYNWNAGDNNGLRKSLQLNRSTDEIKNNSPINHQLNLGSIKYRVIADPVIGRSVKYVSETSSNKADYATNFNTADINSTNSLAGTKRPDVSYDTNVARPTYADEWQAIAEKPKPVIVFPTNFNVRNNQHEDNDHSKDLSDHSLQGI